MAGQRRIIIGIACGVAIAALCYMWCASALRSTAQNSTRPYNTPNVPAQPDITAPSQEPIAARAAYKWGGALNSADRSGAAFFDPISTRAFRDSIQPAFQKYVVSLNARAFLPTPFAPADVFSTDDLHHPERDCSVYMQFTEHPTDVQRIQLSEAGVDLLGYVDGYAWTVRGDVLAIQDAAKLPFVRGVSQIDPRDKLHGEVFAQRTPPHAQLADGLTRFSVLARPGTTLAEMTAQIAASPETAALAVTLGNPSVLGPRFMCSARANQALHIAALSSVAFIEFAPPPIANRDAITDSSSNVTLVRDQGDLLDGTGITVAVREIGKPEMHFDFVNRMTFIDTDGDSTIFGNYTHATSVVGQIASEGLNQPTAKGIAPAAKISVYAATTFVGGDAFSTADLSSMKTLKILLSNHSYGPTVSNWGDYQTTSADWDSALRAKNLLAFFAGNEEVGGFDKHIDFFVGMKNGLCIESTSAAAKAGNPFGTPPTAPAGGSASFAEHGPMNDGRIKPDLVAFGQGVKLDVGTSSVTSNSGTSFSTPAATGIAALVQQRYIIVYGGDPTAALMKALLCETATDLGFTGPDKIYGFGIINADAAVRLVDVHSDSPSLAVFFEDAVTNGGGATYNIVVPANTPSLKMTLCWMDLPGNPNAAKALVNDLDLILTDPQGGKHYPYSLSAAFPSNLATNTGPNTVDPIEQTVVANPIAGTWTATVSGTSIPSGAQAFALCTNIPQLASLHANANASPTSGDAPLTVMFSGQGSSGAITLYSWDFGDGTKGVGPTVSHVYSTPNTYMATLTISDAQAQTLTSSPIQITVSTPTVTAVPNANVTTGDVPLIVQFSGTASIGNIQTYTWDFDDGSPTVTGITVSHMYTIAGTYNASLTVTGAFNSTDTKVIQITATTNTLQAHALAVPTSGDAPLVVQFSGNGSTGIVATYTWDFGDGTTATGKNVSHTYTLGTGAPLSVEYLASLTVTDSSNNSSTSPDILITVTKPAPGDIYPLICTAKVDLNKAASNQLSMNIIVPGLVKTPQQARDAIKNGTFEGKTYTVRAGLAGKPLTPLYSFLVDRHASQINKTESFKIDLKKGTILTSFKDVTVLRDLRALFTSFGIDTMTLGKTLTIHVEVETDDALYQANYKATYNGKSGKGTIKGGAH
ncbi:MAG: PKD domain-containing protein [Planctomycetota bacterium]